MGVAVALFEALHAEQVRYCHWKSNEHALAGLRGHTDLDVLIDRSQARAAQQILTRCGFKRFQATAAAGYPAIEDYLGLDPETGALLHCHVHYRLIAGEQHLKGYRLPWERWFLEQRIWDPDLGVYVADPHLELLTLLVRAALKLRVRDAVLPLIGRHYVRGGLVAEYRWLLARVDRSRCRQACAELLGDAAASVFEELLNATPGLATLWRFRWAARSRLKTFKSYGWVTGTTLRFTRELGWVWSVANRRSLCVSTPARRTLPTGGVMVAFIGADGSGKSRMVRKVSRLLSKKVDVFRVYFGSGDGPSSALRWPLRIARRGALAIGLIPPAMPQIHREGDAPHQKGLLLSAARVLWALTLSWEKRRRLKASWKARNLGMIVIADRYPQVQIEGFNDGPLLASYARHSNRLLRWLARHERVAYQWADDQPPDLVIRFSVAPVTAASRKPDMSLQELDRRNRAVGALVFPGSHVVTVDANRPLADVSREVMRLVWDLI